MSGWLSDVLEQLLNPVCSAIRECATEHSHPESRSGTVTTTIITEVLPDDLVDERIWSYVTKLVSYVLRLDDLDTEVLDKSPERRERYQQLREDVESELRNVGTGRGAVKVNGAHLVASVIAPLLQTVDIDLEFVFNVDGESWMDTARETRERSLEAIAALADVGKTTMVCGPRVEHYLCERHPDWSDCVTDLIRLLDDEVRERIGKFRHPLTGERLRNTHLDNHVLLTEIVRVAETLGQPPTSSEFREHGAYSLGPYQDRFGTFPRAVEAAGYEPRFTTTQQKTKYMAEYEELAGGESE